MDSKTSSRTPEQWYELAKRLYRGISLKLNLGFADLAINTMEDHLQDIVPRFLAALDQGKPKEPVKYLGAMIANHLKRNAKKEMAIKKDGLSEEIQHTAAPKEPSNDTSDSLQMLEAIERSLPKRLREIFRVIRTSGLDISNTVDRQLICLLLNISPENLNTSMHRVRRQAVMRDPSGPLRDSTKKESEQLPDERLTAEEICGLLNKQFCSLLPYDTHGHNYRDPYEAAHLIIQDVIKNTESPNKLAIKQIEETKMLERIKSDFQDASFSEDIGEMLLSDTNRVASRYEAALGLLFSAGQTVNQLTVRYSMIADGELVKDCYLARDESFFKIIYWMQLCSRLLKAAAAIFKSLGADEETLIAIDYLKTIYTILREPERFAYANELLNHYQEQSEYDPNLEEEIYYEIGLSLEY